MSRLLSFVSFIVMSFFVITPASSHSIHIDSLEYNLDFRADKSDIDYNYKNNAEVLSQIDSLLTDLKYVSHLDSLSIRITASPEAPYDYNVLLLKNRVASIEEFLAERYPYVSIDLLNMSYDVYNWSEVSDMIKADQTTMPHKEAVVTILDDPNTTELQKEHQVRTYGDRAAWYYISRNYLTQLRRSTIKTELYKMPSIATDIDAMLSSLNQPFPELKLMDMPSYIPMQPESEQTERKPLFALKTNLLYDALTALNISLEVPIGNRFSVAGEWIFPWWTWDDGTADSKRHRLQLLYGNIEARYWFGNRDNREVLTGWFAGLYTGGGKYDLEYNRSGVQGEFFVAIGASGGYAHSINKMNTLRMEYSLSVGYFKSEYRDYDSIFGSSVDLKWHPIRNFTGEYVMFGPTAAKVSLVWMLYYNKKK